MLPPDSPSKPAFSRALQVMRQVIEEGRQSVRSLRSAQNETLDLERALAQIQEEVAPDGLGSGEVAFCVAVQGQRRPLHPLLRDEMYRIGREAILNAFRHARASRIEVELAYSSSGLRMLIRDDGCGIDTQLLKTGREGHWGLAGMRERADRVNARLRIWSSAGKGTEVEVIASSQVAFIDHSHFGLPWFRKRSGSR
jgi:signal transduction histidine kinase